MISSVSSSLNPVGIIGFGLLGRVFAERLEQAGFDVLVYDVLLEGKRAAELTATRTANSIADLVRTCSSILLAVYSSAQVEEVLASMSAVPNAERASSVTILCSTTLEPDSVSNLSNLAADADLDFLEFPVSGTSKQIADGEGFGLLAGDPDIVATERPVIDVLTPCYAYFGSLGAGARAKLAINLVLEINRSALAEGLVFADLMGLDRDAYVEGLKSSAAYSRVMDGKTHKMLGNEFTPEGRCAQSLKDVQMMLDEASKYGQQLPLTSAQADLLTNNAEHGEGNIDSSAVIRALRRLRTERSKTVSLLKW